MDRLNGAIRNYAWGDPNLIAELQGRSPSGQPEAELWLGAHPAAPSTLAGRGQSLVDAVAADPPGVLGPAVADAFGQLPFLLMVLAAAQPLSIQAHPSRSQAQAGFAREEAAGIAWDSPTRTYRDANHKPELICALTRFEAKCGFRPLDATCCLLALLAGTAASGPGLAELASRIAGGGDPATVLGDVLAWLLGGPPEAVAGLVGETVSAAEELLATAAGGQPSGYGPELAWTVELNRIYPGDAGVVVALLLNHVVLQPGQALFLGAGNLHSYLRGGGVELMANSDNVVRGGLTPKHVDVQELVTVIDTRPELAPIQTASGACHQFASPVPDFSLTRLAGPIDRSFEPASAEILLVTSGTLTIESVATGCTLKLAPGQSGFVAWSDGRYRAIGPPGTTAWRAAAAGELGPQ